MSSKMIYRSLFENRFKNFIDRQAKLFAIYDDINVSQNNAYRL